MGNKFVQQVKVVSGYEVTRPATSLSEMAFFDEDGDPFEFGVTPAAHVAPVAVANATDLTSAQALANANKTAINAVIANLIAAGMMSAT